MGVAEEFPSLWSDLNAWIVDRLKEAAELRGAEGGSIFGSRSPKELIDTMVDVRGRLDRLEQIMADLGRLKSRAEAAMQEAQDAYDDAYAVSVQKSHTEEFATAKEKDATHMAASLNQLVALRKAKKRHEQVREAYEYVRTLHKGLDGTRWDVATILDGLTLDLKLDR